MYACICMYVYVCMYMYACICMYVCVCMYVYVCVYIYVCMYVCMYMCVCIHVCVCMHNILGGIVRGGKCPTQNGRLNCSRELSEGELPGGTVQRGIVLHPYRLYRLQHCTVCVNYTMLRSKFNQTPMCVCGCVYVRISSTEFRVSKA